ncbi:MAG TPA: helix-turn-helix transcriptional regulator [Streptosporangiaceae bacterium]|nr:helix-turn-helix transcriptional regulator [Streptosporangiaceae bacterium]
MNFSEALRALMTERAISGNALARRVPCDKALISRLAGGTQQPSANMARRLDDVLGAAGELVALAKLCRQRRAVAVQGPPDAETVTVPCRTPDGRIIFVDVPRRLFLKGAGAAAVAAAVPGALPAAGSPGPELNGHTAAARLALARRVLRDSDNLFGSRQVIPPAKQQAQAARRGALAARGAARQELMQVQVQFADLIGWLYQDSGDHDAAGYWLDRALEWSHLAGDTGSAAFIMARKSQLAADMHDPAGAVAAAEAALRLAIPRTRVAAAGAAYAAHRHALAGDRMMCERHYDEARNLLDRAAGDDSAWQATFCDHAYIGVQRAHSLSILGDYAAAAAGFRDAIGRLQPGYHRDHGVYLAREAAACAGAGEPEHAANLGMQALGIGADTLSARIFTELASLDDMLSTRRALAADDFRAAFASAVLRPA